MAINYSDLYSGQITQNLNPAAKKGYLGPDPYHAGEVVKIRAYFNLADYANETSTNYTVKVCEVPYLGSVVIDKISVSNTYVQPAAEGHYFCSDNGVNGASDNLSPVMTDGTEHGPFREIKCRYRKGALYYTATYAGLPPARISPTVVEATIRQTSAREALVEVPLAAAPIS